MEVISDPALMHQFSMAQKQKGTRVGLVPTMGYLHEGHLSLVAESRARCGCTVLSLFVNPIQFGPNEDYEKYPRDEQKDLALCEAAGVDAVFLPSAAVMYAPGASVTVEESVLSLGLCGAKRPGHFRGVCTVVAKLFNLVQPDVALFGEKDFQQVAVIRRMVRDLNFPIEIVPAPIVRESDGLAKSSRNVYLSEVERQNALGLSKSIAAARDLVRKGTTDTVVILHAVTDVLMTHNLRVDYTALVDPDTLEPQQTARPGLRLILAVYCGRTRLIDNGDV